MKTYYIWSDYYDQDWIDEIERITEMCVFRDVEAIHKAMRFSLESNKFDRYEIIGSGRSSELFDSEKTFNIVFAVQALE